MRWREYRFFILTVKKCKRVTVKRLMVLDTAEANVAAPVERVGVVVVPVRTPQVVAAAVPTPAAKNTVNP